MRGVLNVLLCDMRIQHYEDCYLLIMKKVLRTAKRAVAIFFTWSAVAILVYGICTLQFRVIIAAPLWYFIAGGLTIQSLSDIEGILTGDGKENVEQK